MSGNVPPSTTVWDVGRAAWSCGTVGAGMKALFVTPECYPLVKTGGLADVTGALPLALAPLDVDSRVLLPEYPGTRERLVGSRVLAPLPSLFGADSELVAGTTEDGLEVWLVHAPHLFARTAGGPYLGPDGRDWPDNHLRFAALSWVGAALSFGRIETGGWRPDITHLHDWQAALTAAYVHFDKTKHVAAATLLTIHNLAFQGLFDATLRASLKLPAAAMAVDGLEYWGQVSFLKAGVMWADHLSTVSPTYAREIVTPEHGMGFDGLLRSRERNLTGIVNGIDDAVWNPATDEHLVAPYRPYTAKRLAAKAADKAALQAELGLTRAPDVPLFCVVSRLGWQKGLDLLLDAWPRVAHRAQLAVLGTGDVELEEGFHRLAVERPGSVAAAITFDEALSHRMQAGGDAIVVPSRFEPCGLTQLYGLRYGSLPVVARVGGLADTVIDANPAALRDGVATGFQFSPVDTGSLAAALERACDLFADRPAWQRLVRRAMGREVGWDVAAVEYMALYERIVEAAAQ
jgi:starch synthase